MRLILLALLVVGSFVSAGRLAAQHPSVDRNLAILRAATSDSTEKLAALRTAGDTAWATVVNPKDRFVAGGFPGREVRLLRRGGTWTAVATRPVVVPVPPLRRYTTTDTVAKRP